jgi:hypothetical protein
MEVRLARFMRIVLGLAGLALIALPPLAPSFGQSSPRTVKNAVLQLITGDDGKDDTDVFTVTVTNADGKVLERVFDAKEEIKPFTTFNLWLTRVVAASPEKVKGSTIRFHIDTKWDEHWVVKDARLTVNYDSGPPDRWHWGPFVLQVKGAKPMSLDFPLDDSHKL